MNHLKDKGFNLSLNTDMIFVSQLITKEEIIRKGVQMVSDQNYNRKQFREQTIKIDLKTVKILFSFNQSFNSSHYLMRLQIISRLMP